MTDTSKISAVVAELSTNARPSEPRPPMTFDQQAELLEYLHGRMVPPVKGKGPWSLVIMLDIDQAQVDDLWLTAQRLRRMAGHEAAIKKLVTGQ